VSLSFIFTSQFSKALLTEIGVVKIASLGCKKISDFLFFWGGGGRESGLLALTSSTLVQNLCCLRGFFILENRIA
jgi:hypothetical protein